MLLFVKNRRLCAPLVMSLAFTACAHPKKKEMQTAKVQAPTAAAQVKPVQKSEAEGLAFACLVDKDLRLLHVEKTPKRCEVHYTKFGEKSQVAWAEATPSICSDVRDRIRNNIESAGFQCDENPAKLTGHIKTAASASAE